MYSNSAELYDLIYESKDYAAEARQIMAALDQHAERPVHTLLDVACGTGRHLEQLAARYSVEGLDQEIRMLDLARTRLPSVPFHQRDMCDFDLGKQYDAVTCLFGSIGYARTTVRLRSTVQSMAHHLLPGGVLLLEPFLTPDNFKPDKPYAVFVDRPDLKVARVGVTRVKGKRAILDFHYLVATPDGVKHFAERHELGLFTDAVYRTAITESGLDLRHEDRTLTGRELYVAIRNPST
ncbi:MAG: class I SAM-dependent DNA methyltransferase [Chloroflexota bacterium]